MNPVVTVMSALSDPTRLAAMRLLWDGNEHCVCEMMRLLCATQSRMSRHMGILKNAGLVIDRRDAQWVRYRRNPALGREVTLIVDAVVAALPAASKRKKAA
jgi:ArsR family transcriptional regulator, arsenate/arsenite/antimonite-responsive transcriptional repressor